MGFRRRRGRRRRARRGHEVELLARLRVPVEPRLFLIGGPGAHCPRLKVLWWISCWDVSESLRGREYIRWLLRFFPAPQLLRLAQVAERLALGAQTRLGGRKALTEARSRDTERVLGVDLERAGEGNDREQQVAHLFESAVVVGNLGQLLRLLGH